MALREDDQEALMSLVATADDIVIIYLRSARNNVDVVTFGLVITLLANVFR